MGLRHFRAAAHQCRAARARCRWRRFGFRSRERALAYFRSHDDDRRRLLTVLMAAYYVVARSFPAAAFATMAAFILGIGSVGNIGAAFPLTLLVDALGWRLSIILIALITLVIAALCFVIVKDPPKVETDEKGSLLDLLRMRAIWFILPLVLVSYAPSAGLRGLWVGPYFTDVFDASAAQVGTVTTLMALAMIAGTFCYGPLDRLLGTRKWVIFTGNLIGGLLCFALYLFGDAGFWSTAAMMAGIGFFGASFPILVAHGRSFFPGPFDGARCDFDQSLWNRGRWRHAKHHRTRV